CVASPLRVRPDGAGATIDGFATAYRKNAKSADAAKLGALSDGLSKSPGECLAAAGVPAALAAADHTGHVGVYRDDAVAAAGDRGFLQRCAVTLVAATTDNVDHLVALVEASAPADADVLIVGVSESQPVTAHLHVAIASGPGFGGGELVSASTRRSPFVQLVDVAPTILHLRGTAQPSSMIGQPWRAEPGHSRDLSTVDHIAKLADLDIAAQHQRAAVVPFWVTLVALTLVGSGVAWAIAHFTPRHSEKLRRYVSLVCVWCALLPASSFLAGVISWWRAPSAVAVLLVATAVAAAGLTAFASWLEAVIFRRGAFGLAAATGLITFAVIGLDLLTGAHLQIFTMAGYSPLVAGRFAGIGNVGFGVYAAGAVLAAAGVATVARRPALAIAAIGVLAVAIDGAPLWGSDVGGVLALAPTFCVLAWLMTGVRVSWRRLIAVVVIALGAIAVFAVADYARPARDQTHLGRFVGDLLHGGAWTILRRKAVADVRLLFYSVLTLLIPLMVVVAVLLVRRPPAVLRRAFTGAAALRPALIGWLVLSVIGAVLNDSGVVIPALAVLVVLPATMTVIVASSAADRPSTESTQPPPSLLR
ncbi:MAG TPA: hypothetical protein VFN80_07040, partial [Acidothermaceae bacterium]|nr:hypothetical protein [Acidothermaceae bacterium]